MPRGTVTEEDVPDNMGEQQNPGRQQACWGSLQRGTQSVCSLFYICTNLTLPTREPITKYGLIHRFVVKLWTVTT